MPEQASSGGVRPGFQWYRIDWDAKRPLMRSHAERGNEKTQLRSVAASTWRAVVMSYAWKGVVR